MRFAPGPAELVCPAAKLLWQQKMPMTRTRRRGCMPMIRARAIPSDPATQAAMLQETFQTSAGASIRPGCYWQFPGYRSLSEVGNQRRSDLTRDYGVFLAAGALSFQNPGSAVTHSAGTLLCCGAKAKWSVWLLMIAAAALAAIFFCASGPPSAAS